MRDPPWKKNPARAELLALYTQIDALLAPWTCPASTDCCHFGRTGREPYPHAVELAELRDALAARPPPRYPPQAETRRHRKRSLPMAGEGERRCPVLGDDGRCRAYASRPFGCRTYFCDRAEGPGKWPREEVAAIAREIAALSARAFPRDPGPRRLVPAMSRWRGSTDSSKRSG